MSLGIFLLEAVTISLSGVMAPGPMTATTVGKGSESPHAGAFIAFGHGIVEFPLMVALFYGAGYVLNQLAVKAAIGLLGGAFLLFMGIGMFRSMTQTDMDARKHPSSPLVAGILISIGNPYFLVWWATAGVALIIRSVQFGLVGFLIFALVHWLCDFVWCYFLSALSFKGGRFFGKGFQKAIFAVSGVFLLFLSGRFIFDAIKTLMA